MGARIGIGVWLLAAGLAAQQAPGGSVRIDYPQNGAYVSGPIVIRASITPPSLPSSG
ncbi:MAG: hypothetical protein IMZ67_09230 [Acidobacteria bacterium]|nr:hypothetical protein [Acidobacteriota bacterium]